MGLLKQVPGPEEIVLVLPEGEPVPAWDTPHPRVRWAHGRRGAISQRVDGLKAATTPVVVLLDDDIVFHEPDTLRRLVEAMPEHGAQVVVPYFPGLAQLSGWKKATHALLGIYFLTDEPALRVTPGGSFSYPRDRPGETPIPIDSAQGACVVVDRAFVAKRGLYGDEELQRTPAYAFRDDAAFVMDIVLAGGKALMVDVGDSIEHIGVLHQTTPERAYMGAAGGTYNVYLFWKKYARRKFEGQWRVYPWFAWHLAGNVVLHLSVAARRRSWHPVRGVIDGFKWIWQDVRKR